LPDIRLLHPLFGAEAHGVAIRDNRFTMHRGRPFPAVRRRVLVRATVAGDAPAVPQ